MTGTEEVELYSSWFCPFAQRAWIAAEEKGIPYKLIEVDPYAKPPELMAVNPRGLVPGLRHGTKCVYESMVVMEYIEEAFPAGRAALMPKEPYERAIVRIWMDFVNRKIVPTFYRYLQRQDPAEQAAEREQFVAALAEIGAAMEAHGGSRGPFFMGPQFTLADICLLPWAVRLDVLQHYRALELPEDSPPLARFKTWLNACLARPSVSATLADRDKLRESYRRYADNTATSQVALAVNKNKPLP